jgi:hypothetical protein
VRIPGAPPSLTHNPKEYNDSVRSFVDAGTHGGTSRSKSKAMIVATKRAKRIIRPAMAILPRRHPMTEPA